jgi:hypothetical protein
MLTKNQSIAYRQDAYKVIVGLIDLYTSEGNPLPETASELTGREYTPKMCNDLAIYLGGLRDKFADRRG